jgi:cell division protein FtsQ
MAVTREAGRRRLRRLVVALIVLGAAGVVAGVVWSPILDVDDVAVTGAGERTREVAVAAAVERGSALLLLDTGAVEERVEALAWVGDAEVTRELPGTLQVKVRLRPAVAMAARPDGQVALVDATGIVTAVVPRAPGGIPALVTTAAPPDAGALVRPVAAARVAGAIGPLEGRVARVFVERGQAALLLTDGIEVRLGSLDRLEEKARAADAVLRTAGATGITYVDVRVPAAPVTG